MKKNIYIAIALSLLLALAACSNSSTSSSSAAVSSEITPSVSDPIKPSQSEAPPASNTEMPDISDAAIYRGVLNSSITDNGKTTLSLAQVEGTDFGAKSIEVTLDDTTMSFDSEALEPGSYIQVYYARPEAGAMPTIINAIALEILAPADTSVFNGEIVEITKPDSSGNGSMLLKNINAENTIIFNFSSDTQVYVDINAANVGDKLNVYFSGITTRSLPPQATALEIRKYITA